MDENLARLNRIYPNSKFALIPKYNPDQWKDREYDSSFDNKGAINRWKTNALTYEQACEKLEEGYRIGWIVPKGYVIVDIDNKDDPRSQEYIMKILEKFEVSFSFNYTNHGIHLLFKDSSENIKSDSVMKCGLNITIDTRANETGYIVLPCNDPHRAWGEWGDFVEEIPYFMKPMLKDMTPSFIGMVNGDGRNNAMLKWRSQLERCQKLTEQEVEKCIRIINENLFDEPMSNSELFKTVLRDRSKKADELDKLQKEDMYNKVADDIIGKYDFVSYYSNFYRFNGIYYKPITDIELERIIHLEVNNNIRKAGRSEIIEFLKLKTQISVTDFNKDWYKIACKNGILNLVTGDIETPNKTDINTIYIPYCYNNDPAYSPRIDQFMKEISGGDVIKMQFLYQVAGYCLLKKNLFQKFFIFKGEGGTGKSTYTELLHMMIGGDINCSHVSLPDFDKDYYLASMVGKLLNIDDDVVDGKTLENTGRFKSVVSGNIISCRQIYREVMDFVPYVTCLFSCNRLPSIMDKTSGLYRRMVIVELNNKVLKPDPLFINKITEQDMEYFLFKAVEGIKIAIEEGKFRINQSEQQLLELFKRRQSPLNEWLYENDMRTNDLQEKRCILLYNQFVEWCDANGYGKKITAFTFKQDICALYDMEIEMKKFNESKIPSQVFFKRGSFDGEFKPF